jgi:hypothetical protein
MELLIREIAEAMCIAAPESRLELGKVIVDPS